jgi:hypothetical protein
VTRYLLTPSSLPWLCLQARNERESALGSLSRAADSRRAAEARELSEARAELARARAERDAAEVRHIVSYIVLLHTSLYSHRGTFSEAGLLGMDLMARTPVDGK